MPNSWDIAKDRIVIDIPALSISIWKKPCFWAFRWHRWLWFCVGPVEVLLVRAPSNQGFHLTPARKKEVDA